MTIILVQWNEHDGLVLVKLFPTVEQAQAFVNELEHFEFDWEDRSQWLFALSGLDSYYICER